MRDVLLAVMTMMLLFMQFRIDDLEKDMNTAKGDIIYLEGKHKAAYLRAPKVVEQKETATNTYIGGSEITMTGYSFTCTSENCPHSTYPQGWSITDENNNQVSIGYNVHRSRDTIEQPGL